MGSQLFEELHSSLASVHLILSSPDREAAPRLLLSIPLLGLMPFGLWLGRGILRSSFSFREEKLRDNLLNR